MRICGFLKILAIRELNLRRGYIRIYNRWVRVILDTFLHLSPFLHVTTPYGHRRAWVYIAYHMRAYAAICLPLIQAYAGSRTAGILTDPAYPTWL